MDWELTTRLLVITLYSAAFITAGIAWHGTTIRARKWSAIAIMAASLAWIVFYIWLLARGSHAASAAGYASRVCSYVTAVALTFMAGQILAADRSMLKTLNRWDM